MCSAQPWRVSTNLSLEKKRDSRHEPSHRHRRWRSNRHRQGLCPFLFWKPLSWLGTIRLMSANDAFGPALWETLVSTTLGGSPLSPATIIARLRSAKNTAVKVDFHGDHTRTCTAHSGATKTHDWMVSVLVPLFLTAGHTVRTQHGVTASAGQRRGDEEVRNYLRDQAGRWSLVFNLSITHDRFGSSGHPLQNG
jgi:hypothetical protein